jgi:RNA polymerase sigma factor (sigma-70 family)
MPAGAGLERAPRQTPWRLAGGLSSCPAHDPSSKLLACLTSTAASVDKAGVAAVSNVGAGVCRTVAGDDSARKLAQRTSPVHVIRMRRHGRHAKANKSFRPWHNPARIAHQFRGMDVITKKERVTPTPPISHDAELTEDAGWCLAMAKRIGAGDLEAESELAARFRPGLLMLLYSRCKDSQLAADLCQDTLLILLKRLRNRSLEDPSRIAAFAAQTARQLAFDNHRRSAVRRTVFDTDAVEQAKVTSPDDDSVDQSAIAALIRSLLAELSSDRDREILNRFYLLEQDKTLICDCLGLAPGTFDQIIFRARARLRVLLKARGIRSRDFLCALLWVPASWLK